MQEDCRYDRAGRLHDRENYYVPSKYKRNVALTCVRNRKTRIPCRKIAGTIVQEDYTIGKNYYVPSKYKQNVALACVRNRKTRIPCRKIAGTIVQENYTIGKGAAPG